ncbi:ras-related protein Rab-37 isoform X4 [Phyllobates terribilis]|uniref:ras-related protein Rab-37 isoform X4 n=1 Tax=Phyllobates terribilis TaxID=111132 RepID=UPI003CCB712E
MCDLPVESNSLEGAEQLPLEITRSGEETMEDQADIMQISSYNEDLQHKTILVGDSSVGKTSLLVQFDQGKFLPGSFTSTVGIGFTVMLLGDSGVGKTCFLVQFKDGAFLSGTFLATVGIDFRNKMVTVDGMNVKLQAWLTEVHEFAHKDVVIMLLGNKCDVNSGRVIRTEDGETLAKEYGIPFMETSAKTGVNVELAFMAVAKELKQRSSSPDDRKFQIHQYIESQKKKSSCCGLL